MSWSASSGASARGVSGPALPTEVTTSQVGPHQSASTSQDGISGGDVIAGMGQQSTGAGPVSTETPSCVPNTTVRDEKTTGRQREPGCGVMYVTEPARPAARQIRDDTGKHSSG